ncbi:MAG: sigma-70 family RNA polymerase sigma factor [Bacteroidetes bacterium]|jgi:RNA polymerase sigma factor (sigma-70 family)|nr:sigma-70 family RNA polymerase sigma factor [Bacteroidota bacterium]MBT6686469.1 sigma-70 family RNA polymerase sigma factor [Bacteroidota bacterium]MBT7143576.1 sigma-70 family RNA polymerase sigma factor [Bacteroidota bacterium]MBT7491374.1 sigma-70 family RNA polymerase sigma factor [Bacteroidota bacterium]
MLSACLLYFCEKIIEDLKQDYTKIINACINNESKFQRKLYDLFSGKMFVVCLQYSNNYEEAKDILQDGFVKVFTNLKQFKHQGSFEGWIRRIMVNTALEKFRQNKIKFIDSEIFEFKDSLSYEDIESNISANDILKVMQELSPQYRTVFNLYVNEGYSHKEISEKLNISVGTSKSNLSRARTILQKRVLSLNLDEK